MAWQIPGASMPITRDFDPSKKVTIFKCEGDLTFAEIAGSIKGFYGEIDHPITKKLVWDLGNASIWSLTKEWMNLESNETL